MVDWEGVFDQADAGLLHLCSVYSQLILLLRLRIYRRRAAALLGGILFPISLKVVLRDE